jgi:hypothetical protein
MKKLFLIPLMIFLMAASCSRKTVQKPVELDEIVISSETTNEKVFFVYKGRLTWMKNLAKVTNCTLSKAGVYEDLSKKKSFDWTSDDGLEVAKKVMNAPTSELKTFKSNYFAYLRRKATPGQGPVTAYRNVGSSDVHFNTRTNPRSIEAMVETGCHEYGHVAGYGHGGNGLHTTGVPSELGAICVRHIKECL